MCSSDLKCDVPERLKGIRTEVHRRLDQGRRQAPEPRKRVVVNHHDAERRVPDDNCPEREIKSQEVEPGPQRDAGDDARQCDRQDEKERDRVAAEKPRALQGQCRQGAKHQGQDGRHRGHLQAQSHCGPDAGPLVLRGMFVSPTASDDASLIGALCNELADEIEFDGGQPTPYLATGVSVDELRKAARVLRCRGVSIGDRQPKARDAIAKYLDEKVGTDGGPLTPDVRAAWVAAYRDIGRAATDAAK